MRPSAAPALQQANLLDIAPRRLAEWREIAGRAVVERPRPTGRGVRAALERVSWHLAPRRIRLDGLGTFCWKRLDGRATVGQLARAVREHYGEGAEPVEERLGQFVRVLRREGLLGYPGWDDLDAAAVGNAASARGATGRA